VLLPTAVSRFAVQHDKPEIQPEAEIVMKDCVAQRLGVLRWEVSKFNGSQLSETLCVLAKSFSELLK
jgi:hypothetical protein